MRASRALATRWRACARTPQSGAAAARREATIPRATYRLQLHRGFTFDDARPDRCRTSARSA